MGRRRWPNWISWMASLAWIVDREGHLEQLVALLPVDGGGEVDPAAAAAQGDDLRRRWSCCSLRVRRRLADQRPGAEHLQPDRLVGLHRLQLGHAVQVPGVPHGRARPCTGTGGCPAPAMLSRSVSLSNRLTSSPRALNSSAQQLVFQDERAVAASVRGGIAVAADQLLVARVRQRAAVVQPQAGHLDFRRAGWRCRPARCAARRAS